MLKYFKSVALISFLCVLAAAFAAGFYFKSMSSKHAIIKPAEKSSIISAEKFTKNIVCRYKQPLDRLSSKPLKSWLNDKGFKKFKIRTKAALQIISAKKVTIYTNRGEEILSTNKSQPVFFGSQDSILEKARKHGFASKVIDSMGFNNANGDFEKGTYLKTIVLADTRVCNNGGDYDPISFIIESYVDITSPIKQMAMFQIIVSVGILVAFATLYLALFITSRKTEKIINKQHEEKLKLQKAKSEAEAQNHEKSMFLANVSHELRTPLNAIIGFSDIIKDEVMGPVGHPQYVEYVNDINSSGVHLLSLINDILDYSKAEARKLDVEKIDIDLNKIAHSCMRLIEPRANEASVILKEHLPENHVVFKADPKRMKQIMLNLLSNAVKFTPEEGEVALTLKKNTLEETVVLTVVDTGIGIEAKDISKAMAPFGQIDSSVSRRYEGTGLGLPLTKKLTELMGGFFDLKSEVGLGTTVCLTFPIVVAEEEKSDDF